MRCVQLVRVVTVVIGMGGSLSAQGQQPTVVKITSVPGVVTGAPHNIVLSAGGPANQNYQFLSATNPETLAGRGDAWNIEGFVQTDSNGSATWSKVATAPSEFYKVVPINGTPGQLYMLVDLSTNSAYTLATGGTSITLGSAKLETVGEAQQTAQLGFTLSSGSASDLVNGQVQVFDETSGAYLGSAMFVDGSSSASLTLNGDANEVVPENGTVTLVFKGDLSALGAGATDGDLVQVNLTSAQGVGTDSGATVNAKGGGSYDRGVRVVKAYPTVAYTDDLTPTGASDGKLLDWTVTANGGDVMTEKFSFGITTNNCAFGLLSITAYSDPNYTHPIPINGDGWDYSFTSDVAQIYYAGDTPFVVPSGATYYFRLSTAITPTPGASSYSVSTRLEGDTIGTSGVENTIDRGYYANMLWSDTLSQAADTLLFNGGGVPGLPATGITKTRTN